MANITISNLHPAGSDLFSDSESYLKELSEEEIGTQGGIWNMTPYATGILALEVGSAGAFVLTSAGVAIGVAVGYAYTRYKTEID